MKKLYLILCLSTATINAMELDTQKANPTKTIQQLVIDLSSVNTQLDSLVKSKDMPNAQIMAKLPEIGDKCVELREKFTQFTSSFNAKEALDSGTINHNDVNTALSTLEQGRFIMTSISLKQTALLQKVKQPKKEESLAYYENPQTIGKALIGIGCCLIVKGLYNAIQK